MSKIIEALKRAEAHRNGKNGVNGGVPQTAANGNGSIAPLDQAVARIKQELEVSEQRAAQQVAEQVRLKSQLAALSQVVAKAEQERAAVQAQFERASQGATAHEASRALLARQLDALRACQALASEVRVAEQEAEQSTQRASQLKFKLAQALAATGVHGTITEET